MRDIIFVRANYIMGYFKGYFEGANTFLTPKLSRVNCTPPCSIFGSKKEELMRARRIGIRFLHNIFRQHHYCPLNILRSIVTFTSRTFRRRSQPFGQIPVRIRLSFQSRADKCRLLFTAESQANDSIGLGGVKGWLEDRLLAGTLQRRRLRRLQDRCRVHILGRPIDRSSRSGQRHFS